MTHPPRLRGWQAAAALACLAVSATTALAQGDAPPAGTNPPFVITSDNGDNRVRIGALVQADGRLAITSPEQVPPDTFAIRRLRTVLDGQVGRHMDFYVNVDVAAGLLAVRDAYFDTRFSPAFRVRAGKARVPFSYDRSLPVAQMLFTERGLVTTVAPDRDTGVQVLGDLHGNRLSYQVAVTNGVVDGGSADGDTNRAKDLAGKLTLRPWVGTPGHPLAGLTVITAGTTGVQGPALPAFLSYGRQTFFSYAGAVADGRRSRWSPMAIYSRGPFWGWVEYVRSTGGVRTASGRGDVTHSAFEATASWVLTGEASNERNVRPRMNFDPPSHHWGAWQLAARYEQLAISANAATLGAATGSSRLARSTTVGLNWYLNPYVKYNVDLIHTAFEGLRDTKRPAENTLLVRAQVGF